MWVRSKMHEQQKAGGQLCCKDCCNKKRGHTREFWARNSRKGNDCQSENCVCTNEGDTNCEGRTSRGASCPEAANLGSTSVCSHQ
jgi:hypothetical protein